MKLPIYVVVIVQLLIFKLSFAQNAKPVVTAGADQTLSIPNNSITLTGSASDADGNIVSYTWTRASGPSATFTNANQPTVTVTNLKKGVNIFRLTAIDNLGATNSDDVTVIYDQPARKVHTKGGQPMHETYYWEFLPKDYATNPTKRYPLILFLHGCGERSYVPANANCDVLSSTPFDSVTSYNMLDRVLKFGPTKEFQDGHTLCFTNTNGIEECFLVMSPQLSGRSSVAWSPRHIRNFLTYVKNNYRVDESRIYLTGISLGGIGTYGFAQGDEPLATSLAAIAPVSGKGNVSKACLLATRDIPVWAHHGDQDRGNPGVSFNADKQLIDSLKRCNPDPAPRFTVYAGLGHVAAVWNKAYDTNSPPDSNYPENLYTWFLKYSKPTGTNQLPVANAGTDATRTLPDNSISLTGAATDSDGTISTYLWSKQLGPSATLSGTNQAVLTVSDMVEGVYTFRLTVTDNQGGSTSDEVTVTVNPAPTGGWLALTSKGVAGKAVGFFYNLPKDHTNKIPVPGTDHLEFYIKRISGSGSLNSLRIEMTVSFQNRGLLVGSYLNTLTTDWTKVSIPLTDFGHDPARWSSGVSLVAFKVIGGFGTGAIGVDEIHFTGGSSPVVWYGNNHEVSASPEVVAQDTTAFYISNRFTSGGAPNNIPAVNSTSRFAKEQIIVPAERIDASLLKGNTVSIYSMQGNKLGTFSCSVDCSVEELVSYINHSGLYILRITTPSGAITSMKINVSR